MKIELLINGQVPDPRLGVFNGHIQEGINQVTRIELLALSDVEFDENELENMIGATATLKLSGPVNGELQVSRFDGTFHEIHQMNNFLVEREMFAYRLVIRPWIWQLHIGANTRSFPKMTRIEVIEEVLAPAPEKYDTNYMKEGDYPVLWQILQSETSDWEFVRQLMREAGINFYFGAPKDDSSEEIMHLVDDSNFFPKVLADPIPWNPASGLVSELHIRSLETQARTVPESVESTVSFGDGMVRAFAVTEDVPGGAGSTFRSFGVEGQEEAAAKHRSKVLSEGFGAHRLTYQGESNHFLIRAGERIAIGGPYLDSEKKILVSAVNHRFHRTVPAAFNDEEDVAYENTFVGVKADAQVRPIDDVIEIDTGTADRRALLLCKDSKDEDKKALEALEETVRQLTETVHHLAKSDRMFGMMLGEVVEDARVTDGKEMTCRIENERFPQGITAKVSVAWLVPGGGVTCLPRVGMQVYFLLEQGPGGQHEAVVVGYRPSTAVPGQDPSKTTETHRLEAGTGGDLVVQEDSFEPRNRQRVGIRGENAVCEVTLLDDDGSVSINAEQDVYLKADQAFHLQSDTHLHMADVVGEQYGEVDRYVDRDQTEWIQGNHGMTVSGDRHIQVEKNVSERIGGDDSKSVDKGRTVEVGKDNSRTVDGNETITVNKGRRISVSRDHQETVKGNKTVLVKKDLSHDIKGNELRKVKKSAAWAVGEVIEVEAGKKVQITCGSATVTIEKNGNVTVNGKKITQKAMSDITLKGTQVKIN